MEIESMTSTWNQVVLYLLSYRRCRSSPALENVVRDACRCRLDQLKRSTRPEKMSTVCIPDGRTAALAFRSACITQSIEGGY